MAICVIIGTGNGGQALGGFLSYKGHRVRLWSRNIEKVKFFNKKKKIRLEGKINIEGEIDFATVNIKEALNSANIIFIVVPAHLHREIAKLIAPFLFPSQYIILNPGRTAGSLEFFQVIKEHGCKECPLIIETQSLLFACRLRKQGVVEIRGVKENNLLSFYPHKKEMKIESHKLDVVIHSFLPFRMKVEVWRNESMVGEAMARFRRASFDLPEGSYIVKIYARNRFIGERFVKLNDDKKIHVFCSFEGKLVVNTNDGIEAILLDENGIVAKNTSSDGYTILKAPLFYKYRLRLSYKGFILYETELYLPHRSIEKKFSFHPFYVSILDAFGFPFEENVSISISKDNSYLYGEKRGKIYAFENIPEGDYLLKINYKNFELHRNIHIPCESLKIEIPIVYPVKVKVYDNRGIAIKARVKFERNGKEFETKELPPGKYRINVYSGKKASMEKYISTNEKIDIVINKNSWILYACIFSIAFASIFFIYRKNYIAFVITMLSISITLRWWHAGNANLYILPPSMIEFYSSYGKIISLPSLLKYSLILTLILFISSIVLSIIKKYKYSIFPLIASISIFIYSIHKLAKYTTGSIYGHGLLNNAMQTWGMGIGFYIAIIYAILIVGLIINEVRRSR